MSGLSNGELETGAQMGLALRGGEVTSVELVERALRRAEEWQRATNAFSQLWPEESLDAARRVDEGGARALAVAGIPIAVKDLYDVAGHETTSCCAAYEGNVAASDAPTIARIRQAGLVMIGKTNQHELAAGGTNLVSSIGRTGNPWEPARMTGGSSGGSGAAVAAGVVPWALGSDTGGSIRIPSSMCGTFGLKPTTGRLPIDGLLPLAPSMDCPGPLAATATDLRELYGLLAQPPFGYVPLSWPRTPRVGVPKGFFADRIHAEVAGAVEAAARILGAAGAEVAEVEGYGIEDARRVWNDVCWPEFAEAHPRLDAERRTLVHPSVVAWLEGGETLSADRRAEASRRRQEIARWFGERLANVNALLIPTTPYPAPWADAERVDLGPAGTVEIDRVGPGWITCSVNLANLPAVNLPVAVSSEGLPIGVSLVGREDAEGTLIRLAREWEEAAGYRPRRPVLPDPSRDDPGPAPAGG
jgi:aspartyl-tRNA(Asn)/glutamyl-tRNA(Gln) amidotransferase subunit A